MRGEGGQGRLVPAVRRPHDAVPVQPQVGRVTDSATDGAAAGAAVLGALERTLAPLGLNLLLPLAPAAFDAACAPVAPGLELGGLRPEARAAVVVGSGGRPFFERFEASDEARDGAPDPLDRYTRRTVEAAGPAALAPLGVGHAVLFPFASARPVIPFQRLGRAAGLGAPGPLGLQIHPVFGPWWAYRALLLVDAELPSGPPPGDACAGCPAPCVAACPAGAVRVIGFSIPDCHARRLAAEPCRLSCAARIACIRGPEHRYADRQLAFHMAASMPKTPRAP